LKKHCIYKGTDWNDPVKEIATKKRIIYSNDVPIALPKIKYCYLEPSFGSLEWGPSCTFSFWTMIRHLTVWEKKIVEIITKTGVANHVCTDTCTGKEEEVSIDIDVPLTERTLDISHYVEIWWTTDPDYFK